MERGQDPRYVPEEYQRMEMEKPTIRSERPGGGTARSSGEGFYSKEGEVLGHNEGFEDLEPTAVGSEAEAYQIAKNNPGRAVFFFAQYNPKKIVAKKTNEGIFKLWDMDLGQPVGYSTVENPTLSNPEIPNEYKRAS